MLKSILEFFDQRIGHAASAGAPSIQRATAALLAEMVRIDRDITPEEQAIAQRAIREKFGLSQADAAELLHLADAEARDATDYYQFTSLINRDFTQEQKERVIELLWQVAYADDELSAHELHLMR
ncbi:MAG: TerB family tellurite resistance protein, partial [Burkholderiaceae bacterium]|nr:TerB family tellurite resistance protein [Burkholderiaceae bacterium]